MSSDLVEQLLAAERTATPLPAPTTDQRLSAAEGYPVQAERNARLDGGGIVGWKIGLTSPGARQTFKAAEPMRGVLFARSRLEAETTIDLSALCAPRLEGEILFRIGSVPPRDADDEALLDSIASVHAAFEVADSRFRGWEFGIGDAIADNACCARFGYVEAGLDPRRIDLAQVSLTITDGRADAPVSSGTPGVGPDSPLAAYRWLLDSLARDGLSVIPGQVVLTGAMGPMVPMQAERQYRIGVSLLGDLSVTTRRTAPVG